MKRTGSWMKLEGRMAFHSKVVRAGNAAVGAWARMGAWSAGERTDGAIPSAIASAIASAIELSDLVKVGLLEQVDENTYKVHDFEDYNITSGEWSVKRAKKVAAGKKGARKRWQNDGKCHAANQGSSYQKTIADSDTMDSSTTVPSSACAEAALAALRRYPELGPIANEANADALALAAFDHGATPDDVDGAVKALAARVRSDVANGAQFETSELGRMAAGYVRNSRKRRRDWGDRRRGDDAGQNDQANLAVRAPSRAVGRLRPVGGSRA